ncbi:pore-forming ESAT-6 family protein [Agrobacterium sp.]|uniref:pore-forming ESAT-6 family protein n=1 Tax=Agrobacterium sp. TaxID=361 RepID=UPI0028B1321D
MLEPFRSNNNWLYDILEGDRNMKILALTAILTGATITAAFAQQPTPEQVEMAYTAARNQLGVLTYCQGKGHIDDTAAEVQTKLLALVPAPADVSKGDAAEDVGKQGKVSVMGMEQDLATAAKAQGVDEAKLCETMSNALKQAAANLPQ